MLNNDKTIRTNHQFLTQNV